MIKKNYNNFGFTLLEIIIVLAIIGLLAASTMFVFGNFNKKQNLSIAYDNVFTALSEAKSFSLSQVVHECDDASGGELLGYRVNLLDEKEYVLEEVCYFPPPIDNTTYESVENDTASNPTLPGGVRFGSSQDATFYVQTRAGVVNAADVATLVLVDEGGASRTINVTATGVISGN